MPHHTGMKRKYGAYRPQVAKGRRRASYRRTTRGSRIVPGRTRQAGFYGRYAPSGGEQKFHDLDIDDAVIATSGIAEDSCLTIAQGVTESQRVGRKCTVKNIGWKYQITLPSTTGDTATSDTVRVILYQDKQTNGATATVAGILESADFQSFNNLSNSSRFRTLLDRTYDLNAPSGGTSAAGVDQFGEFTVHDSFYKRCNMPIEYDSTTGAITEMRSNNVGVLLLSSQGLCAFGSKMRVRFSDN